MPRNLVPGKSMLQTFGELRNDYSATRSSKFRRTRTGLPSMGSGADYHLRNQSTWLKALETARDMDRNDSLIGTMVDRAVDAMIQDGIDPDPSTGDEGVDAELAARWLEWGSDQDQCDLMGEMTFDQMEWYTLRQTLVDGDIIPLLTVDESIQMIEAHRMRTPTNTKLNVVNGVLINSKRKRLEYWVTKDDLDPNMPLKNVGDITRIPVRDKEGNRVACHVYNPKRVTQTRGVSALWPIFDTAGMCEDINFALLVKQQVAACFAIFRERMLTADPTESPAIGPRSTETMSNGGVRTLEGIGPGMDIEGAPGEKMQGFSPNIQSPEFFNHMKMILTQLSINLGLPLCVALMDGSETNFSGYRGALDQAKMGWRRNQRALRDRFHRPVYLWKVRNWIASDPSLARAAARKKVDIFRHTWKFPGWPYIEPAKDATADTIRLKGSHTSPRRILAERGLEWRKVHREFTDDLYLAIEYAKQRAAEINKKFPNDPVPVQWRDLINLPTGDGITLKLPDLTTSNDSPSGPPADKSNGAQK